MPASDALSGRPVAHRHRVRVYWEDTDAGGVVYYANYLKFFERARTEWLRSVGIGQQALKDETGTMFVVAEARVSYRQPARLDDVVEIGLAVAEAGRASLVLVQQALRENTLLAEARIRIGCVDSGTLRPCRIPEAVLARLCRQPDDDPMTPR
ncbi:MAG TPA: tol-pal system-associated acyl-CoA thioesterase [Rubrivivax sp.]|nr:tol-pal system-associated acyl-CoA thioesterase [Burkholderiales bacterium]HNT38800.1 tol-pal system-associated acyl-CoA thioesterase [Rubrivivax sp.]